MAPVIQVRDLAKKYHLGSDPTGLGSLRESLVNGLHGVTRKFTGRDSASRDRTEFIWALKGVSFDVEEGEVLGVIGRNGAGKSTLLKLMARITEPTGGEVRMRGRMASLLEVGTGFHPELSGRENIYLNGAILGMSRQEIEAHFDEIVSFSGLAKFLDTPVKRYSSGMYVRLAFAVAAHLEPEILVIDEVLSVGDVEFQKKCLKKMSDIGSGGDRTILFVSHNMAALERLCQRAIVLSEGQIVFEGSAKDGVNFYLRSLDQREGEGTPQGGDLRKAPGRLRGYKPHLTRVELFTGDDESILTGLPIGAPLGIRIQFELPKPVRKLSVGLRLDTGWGERLLGASTSFDPGFSHCELPAGQHTVVCEFPALNLMPAEYFIAIALLDGSQILDWIEEAARLVVTRADFYGTGKLPEEGRLVVPHHWRLETCDAVEAHSG